MAILIPTNLPQEILDKYNPVNNTFIGRDKGEVNAERQVEIGDVHSDDFQPQVKFKQWSNETNFSVRLIDDEPTKPTIETEGNKIKFIKKDRECHFYDVPKIGEMPDCFEFEVLLKKKPKTNKVEFTTQSKGLKFYYQPELTQEEIDEGHIRPENVIGSYAVYHESKAGDYSKMAGKNYMAGKAFHIYRPKIIDSAGKEVWGKLNITDNLLTVEIPQEFLDNAVYPVIVDPTFGETNVGGSSAAFNDNAFRGGGLAVLGEAGTGVSISAYMKDLTYSWHDIQWTLWKQQSGTTYEYIAQAYEIEGNFVEAWKTSNLSTSPDLTAANYFLMFNVNTSSAKTYVWYDYTDNINFLNTSHTYGTAYPSTVVLGYGNANKYSIYCTYTAGGATETKTIQAKARIQQAGVAKTVQAKGRVKTIGVAKTIQAKARIFHTEEKTVQAKARVEVTEAETVQSKTRIKDTGIAKTTQSKARIETTIVKTIQARARIENEDVLKNVQVKADIKQSDVNQTIQSKSAVKQSDVDQDIQSKARVQRAEVKTVQAKARLETTEAKTIQSKARLKQEDVAQTIRGKARIKQTEDEIIQAKARLETTPIKTIQSKADIKQLGVAKSIQAKAKIGTEEVKTIQAKARLKQKDIDETIQAKADIKQSDIDKTIQVKARLKQTEDKTIQAKARIKDEDIAKTVQAKARLKDTEIKTIQSKADIKQIGIAKTIQAKAKIEAAEVQTIQAKADIKKLGVPQTVQTKANILGTVIKTITAKANLWAFRSGYVKMRSRDQEYPITLNSDKDFNKLRSLDQEYPKTLEDNRIL